MVRVWFSSKNGIDLVSESLGITATTSDYNHSDDKGDVGVEPKCDFQWMTLAGRTPPSTPDSVLDHYAPQHRIIRARSFPALWSVMRLHK
ncbi:hypothetical protein CEXT_519731 [Caerostris extrusa]|uniref:Uncharacterized protein n=1 Tax=Caerostris extrusa TaxID=172846 RepID=A0AAV4MWH8_CAEEX|nr:hypothetical protein CEXT_519731 [Caerostris extrusa]